MSVLGRYTRRLVSRQVYGSWKVWCEMVETRRGRVEMIRKQVLRLRNACVYRSWLTWITATAAMVRAKVKIARVTAVWRRRAQKTHNDTSRGVGYGPLIGLHILSPWIRSTGLCYRWIGRLTMLSPWIRNHCLCCWQVGCTAYAPEDCA